MSVLWTIYLNPSKVVESHLPAPLLSVFSLSTLLEFKEDILLIRSAPGSSMVIVSLGNSSRSLVDPFIRDCVP